MGKAGRQKVEKEYSLDRVVNNMERFIRVYCENENHNFRVYVW